VLQSMVDAVPPGFDVEIHGIGTSPDASTAPRTALSERQRAAVTAAKLGYYDTPRGSHPLRRGRPARLCAEHGDGAPAESRSETRAERDGYSRTHNWLMSRVSLRSSILLLPVQMFIQLIEMRSEQYHSPGSRHRQWDNEDLQFVGHYCY
jgi:hypothetical protein